MKKKQLLLGLTTLSFFAIILAGCGKQTSSSSSRTNNANVLNLSTMSEVSTLDSARAEESVSLTQLYTIDEGLYRLGKDSKIENALATKTTKSANGLKYTFKIRNNDKWNNGKPVVAKDFVYGWRRVANPKTAAGYAYLFEGIKNFDAIQKGKISPNKLGVSAPNDHTLVVTLSKPVPYFKLLMAFPTFFPQQQSTVEKYGKSYGTTSAKTAYNGPFKPSGWTGTNDTWKLTKNSKYWDKKTVHLSGIKFQVVKSPTTGLSLYQQGRLDATPLSGAQVPTYKNKKSFKQFVGGSTVYLEMNQKKNQVLKNRNIRKALAESVDKPALANKVLRDGSTAPKGFVSTNLFKNPKTKADFANDSYVKAGIEYNPTQATKLWRRGLAQVGKKQVTLNLLTDDDDQTKQAAQYLQSKFEKLPGLKITISNVPKKNRLSRATAGQFDLVISSWGADFADPINFLSLLTTGNSYNNGKYSSKTYDKLINKSATTDVNDPTKRYNDLVAAEKELMNQQGVIPLYQPATTALWRTNIHGFVWNPAGMSNGYKNISLNK